MTDREVMEKFLVRQIKVARKWRLEHRSGWITGYMAALRSMLRVTGILRRRARTHGL